MNILFICSGNTCRSPMAEGLLRFALDERKISDVTVSSCGITADSGAPASANAVSVMAEKGIDISAHRARQATGELLSSADIIYALAQSHIFMLTLTHPDAVAKTRLLGNGVPDPYGGSMETYRAARDAIAAEIPAVIDEIRTARGDEAPDANEHADGKPRDAK